jgi:hypothetical protein
MFNMYILSLIEISRMDLSQQYHITAKPEMSNVTRSPFLAFQNSIVQPLKKYIL